MRRTSGNIKMQRIMKKIYLMCAVALLAAVGCNKEIEDGSAPVGSVVLTATVESDATKVGAEVNKETSKVAFTWTKGDAIAVQTASGYETFTLTGDGGAATGEFTGNASPVANAAAVFPAAAAGSGSDVNLPAEYDYVSGQTNALLYATVTSDNNMSFKHLGGLLSFELKGVPAGSKLVLTAAGMKINGAYDITDGQVNAVATETASESTVTVKFAEKTGSAVVYIPLPVGEYASLKAQLIGADDVVISEVATTETKSIARKTVKAMPYIVVDLDEWFITPAGAGKKDGSSWDNAMGTAELRALLAQPVDEEGNQIDEQAHLKASILDGGTIYMAAGDYYLAGEADGQVKVEFTSYEKSVEVTIEGGYPAGLTGVSKEGRDVEANVSAFTGNKEAGILLFGNQTDFTFDGLTLKDANFSTTDGGAIRLSAGSSGTCNITLNSCRFIGNKNTDSKTGAALYIDKATVTLTNCYFADNYARNGSCIQMDTEEGTCLITKCVFENNSTYNTSGAIQNKGKASTFKECIFQNNVAGVGTGGVYHAGGENSSAIFEDCKFIENTAIRGGAVSFEGTTCTFTRCEFTDNKAVGGSIADGEKDVSKRHKAGGAIVLMRATDKCTLNDCTFKGNSAPNGRGGAIYGMDQAATLTINAGTEFIGNSAYFDGGAIALDGHFTINGTSESRVVFSGNKGLSLPAAGSNGGAISLWSDVANQETVMSHVLFSGNEAGQESGSTVNYSNGGAVSIGGIAYIRANNCEFTANRGRNGGCLALNTSATSTFTDCNFHDNICRSGANKNESNGNFYGAVMQIGAGSVEFNNCVFSKNVVKTNSAVAHMNAANISAKFTDCEFTQNQSFDNHGCFKMEKTGQKLYLNRCLFEGNGAKSRGMISVGVNCLVYMNDVTFKDNYTTDSGNSWGVLMHCGTDSNVCMNNVTSYSNYNQKASSSNKVVAFNGDGGWLAVNSTFVDRTPLILRANGSRKMRICNNIIINTMAADQMFIVKYENTLVDSYNLMSCTTNSFDIDFVDSGTITDTVSDSNLLSQSETTLGGSYSANWTATHPYGVYLWTNALTNFTPATATDVYNAISGYTETDTNVVASGTIGADFWKWLKEIGEVTESGTTYTFKDARGVTRTGTMWPGAYQAN